MIGDRHPHPGSGTRRLLAPLATALLLWACGGEERARSVPVPDSVYVEVMAQLVLLDSAMTGPAVVPLRGLDRDSARQRVLERHGVDADALVEFAEERGRSPAAMSAIWRRIQELRDSLEASDWRPPAAEGADEGDPPDSTPPGATS